MNKRYKKTKDFKFMVIYLMKKKSNYSKIDKEFFEFKLGKTVTFNDKLYFSC